MSSDWTLPLTSYLSAISFLFIVRCFLRVLEWASAGLLYSSIRLLTSWINSWITVYLEEPIGWTNSLNTVISSGCDIGIIRILPLILSLLSCFGYLNKVLFSPLIRSSISSSQAVSLSQIVTFNSFGAIVIVNLVKKALGGFLPQCFLTLSSVIGIMSWAQISDSTNFTFFSAISGFMNGFKGTEVSPCEYALLISWVS